MNGPAGAGAHRQARAQARGGGARLFEVSESSRACVRASRAVASSERRPERGRARRSSAARRARSSTQPRACSCATASRRRRWTISRARRACRARGSTCTFRRRRRSSRRASCASSRPRARPRPRRRSRASELRRRGAGARGVRGRARAAIGQPGAEHMAELLRDGASSSSATWSRSSTPTSSPTWCACSAARALAARWKDAGLSAKELAEHLVAASHGVKHAVDRRRRVQEAHARGGAARVRQPARALTRDRHRREKKSYAARGGSDEDPRRRRLRGGQAARHRGGRARGAAAGEVLVEIKATGVCHTDEFTRSGADPEGLFPVIFGHEGAGIVVDVGAGVTSVQTGRPRHPALHARVPRLQVVPQPQDQPVHGDPRHAGQGPDARRHQPLLASARRRIHHYMGCSTFANHTVLPEIALAKVRPDAPFDKVCYIGCGVTTGDRRGDLHRQGRAGRERGRVRAGRHRPQRRPGRAHGRRRQDHRRRPQPGARGARAPKFGLTHFVNPAKVRRRSGRAPRRADRRRRRLQLRVRRQRRADAPGARVLPPRLGRERSSSASPAPGRRSRRAPSSSSPGGCGRARPSAARAAAPTCRASSTGTWTGKIDIDQLITHKLPLERINEAFDLMHAGKSIRTVVEYGT